MTRRGRSSQHSVQFTPTHAEQFQAPTRFAVLYNVGTVGTRGRPRAADSCWLLHTLAAQTGIRDAYVCILKSGGIFLQED